jgi:mannose-6-phosphate isomerase-like protein (cupin superfamily)
MRLLADADASSGAVSITSGSIAAGLPNTKPHFHRLSWEVFYVVDGGLEMRFEDATEVVRAGGLVAVPPGVVHSFGATADGDVQLLVFITPGVQRFDYFRMLPKILRDEIPPDELAAIHDKYDVNFV